MNKILKIVGGVFFTIGILIIAGGIYLKVTFDSFVKTAVKTEATITHIDYHRDSDGDIKHTVLVAFIVDNKEYTGALNYYDSSMYIGKKESIYYDPANPNHFKGAENSVGTWVLLVMGIVFSIIGGSFLFFVIRKNKKRKKVLSYNYVIHANIVGFNLNTSLSVNGRHPYRLDATYINPSDGKIYSYNSEAIWTDLTPILNSRQITTIPVYVNPNNFAEYYMDISSLQQFIGN